MASMHIFLDWKDFVDGAVEKLVEKGELFVETELDENGNTVWKKEKGLGTEHKVVDGVEESTNKEHEYVELYTDREKTKPLIDYTYCKDDDGNIIHDRFDYWSVDDFK